MTDHIVILHKRWLTNVFNGTKRTEFRAGRDRRAPHAGKVQFGDRLWLKAPGGPLVGIAYAENVYSGGPMSETALALALGDLAHTTLNNVWFDKVMTARYVTAVDLRTVERLTAPIEVSDIRGRRQDGWQVLDDEDANTIFERYYDNLLMGEEVNA